MRSLMGRARVILSLTCLLTTICTARPDVCTNIWVTDDFTIRIHTHPGPQVDYDEAIAALEDTIMDMTSSVRYPLYRQTLLVISSADNWQWSDLVMDKFNKVRDGPIIASLAEGPGEFDIVARADTPLLFYNSYQILRGILKWMRLWRDEGWVEPAIFESTWFSSTLPGSRFRTQGTIGQPIAPTSLGNATVPDTPGSSVSIYRRDCMMNEYARNETTSVPHVAGVFNNGTLAKNFTSMLRNGDKPRDPWELNQLTDTRTTQIRIHDFQPHYYITDSFRSLIIDCEISSIANYEKGNHLGYPERVRENPVVCGSSGGQHIELKARNSGVSHFMDVDILARAIRAFWAFYEEWKNSRERWAPSVEYNSADVFDDHRGYRNDTVSGYIGLLQEITDIGAAGNVSKTFENIVQVQK